MSFGRTKVLRRVISAILFAAAFSLAWARPAMADSVAVRYPQGAAHGFLVLRTLEGKIIATGDATQMVHGKRIRSELVFHFRDGSVDDDVAVYTQEGTFRLQTDHHVQRGPSFPKSSDVSIDVASGTVVLREPGNNGQDKVKTEHVDLPPDLGNGIWLTLMENIRPSAAKTTLSYLAPVSGARLIHLTVAPIDTSTFRVGGSPRTAQHFQAKIDLGGITGAVAPLIGKQPHDLNFWLLEGTAAPGFVREEGQFYEGGPVWRIEQTSPVMH